MYINIRRGQFICAVVGAWAMTPWNILVSAESLINFMSGYTIWLAPISGILIADYWFVHKQVLSVPDMYRPDGIYAYNRFGTNWRAVVAFFIGFVPLLPGFAKSVRVSCLLRRGDQTDRPNYTGQSKSRHWRWADELLLSRIFLRIWRFCWTPCSPQ